MQCIARGTLSTLLLLSISIAVNAEPPEYPGIMRGMFSGHTDRIFCVAVSGDGKTVASGGADKTVRLWDMSTGKERGTLDHIQPVVCLAFSADGKRLATGSGDIVLVWEVDSGAKLATLKCAGPVVQVAFAGDGITLAASGPNWKSIWDTDTKVETATVKSGTPYFALAPDGKTLAIGSPEGDVQLWDVMKCVSRATLKGHDGIVFAMRFSPDGKSLATGGYAGGMRDNGKDRSIRLWDVATGRELATLSGHRKGLYSLTFSPDGKSLLATDCNGSMKLWDTEGARVVAILEKVKADDKLRGTPVGLWAISPDLKTWVVGAGREVTWLDIAEFAGAARGQ